MIQATNFSDRSKTKKETKKEKKDYFDRGTDKVAIKNYVEEQLDDVDTSKVTSNVNFSQLKDSKNITYDQFTNAAINKIYDKASDNKIFNMTIEETTPWIGAELDEIMQSLPDDSIKNTKDLKAALKKRIENNKTSVDSIDRETFESLISKTGVKKRVPVDLSNAPEFKTLKKEYEEGLWKSGDKEITFTHLRDADFKQFMDSIDAAFEDPEMLNVTQIFINMLNNE